VSARSLALLLFYAGALELSCGDRTRAEELWTQVELLARRTHVVSARLYADHAGVILSIIDGDFEAASGQLEQFVRFADESGARIRGRMFMLTLAFRPLLETGRAQEWLAAFQEYSRLRGASPEALFAPMAALCHAHLGHLDTARALLGRQLDEAAHRSGPEYRELMVLLPLLEVAILLGHKSAVATLAHDLERVADLAVGDRAYTSAARVLGEAAASAGERLRARAYCEQALASCSRISFRPELALLHLELAELLVADGHPEALTHLDTALRELGEMKMQPSLERAQRLRSEQMERTATGSQHRENNDGLTRREHEVLALLAAGRNNREIASQLVISQATVEVHVKHIMSKLGLRSRTQVAVWAADQHSKTYSEKRGLISTAE
jgi:DNA-binding CsgD family transcriptional regulator